MWGGDEVTGTVNSRRVVCLTPTFGLTTDQAERLLKQAGAELIRVHASDSDQQRLEITKAVALIVGTQPVDHHLVSGAPMLRVIAKHGTGVDNIDVRAAIENGVMVTNAPNFNSLAVAEFTIGLMIAVARGIVRSDNRIRRGDWSIHVGRQLAGATVGIVGMGAIGRLVANRAQALGMHVLCHDIAPLPKSTLASGWESAPLLRLLEQSDFVTLHLPLVPETINLIDESALRRMKPTAFLINAARGRIVDETLLGRALSEGLIAGAALDVFSDEPLPVGVPLMQEDRIVLTPHTAAYTEEALAATSVSVAENVVAVLGGQRPPFLVNAPESLA